MDEMSSTTISAFLATLMVVKSAFSNMTIMKMSKMAGAPKS